MAIFNLKKNKKETVAPAKTKKLAVSVAKETKPAVIGGHSKTFDSHVIVRPRVTEKASMLSVNGVTVVVFEVSSRANKRNVADAIHGLYKVTPTKIAIVPIPAKRKFVRGHMTKGVTSYKAYVYLKKGEKIDIA
ncbi:MAG: 50S ribosomal protein L23 [Candidatus Taylorbacteria bacterium]|nr:50S ribosomal protein L23 [Candidatus Taylorbacteria bacterium]